MKKIVGFLIICACLAFSLPGKTKAATKGIQISPLSFNFDIQDGQNTTGKIVITNFNDDDLNYALEVENFAGVTDEGAVMFAGREELGATTTLADWFTFDAPREGVVSPHKDQEINFTIDIPAGAEPGGHYAAVFAREIRKTASGQTELGVASRVGSLVLVSVPGEVSKTGRITDFTFPKFIWKGPAEFTMKVENTGSVHYDSKANVELSPVAFLGKKTNVDLGTHTIIPKNIRNYDGKLDKKYPFGIFKVNATATDGSGTAISAGVNATIIAIPLMIVIPGLLGLILLIWLILYLKKHLVFRS